MPKMCRYGRLLAALFASVSLLAAGSGRKTPSVPFASTRSEGAPRSTLLNINGVAMWVNDNGVLEQRADLSAGVTFPRKTATLVNVGGFVWGGDVSDNSQPQLRVGGQTYRCGTVPGRITAPGIAEDLENADVRVYRIRRDWLTADLSLDAAEFFQESLNDVTPDQISQLRDQYRRDWMEWPWQKGAPYYERNGIPGYQPDAAGAVDSSADEPGLGQADEVVWFVANDLNSRATRNLYGTPPIGLEMQVTCWAYSHIPTLANVIFQRCRLIYKGTATTPPSASISQMYIAKWSDIDLGDFSDDLAGCMPDRNMAYVYNSTPNDLEYDKYKLIPPVLGYQLLEGPRVPRAGSSAHWDLHPSPGYANLPMTSMAYFSPARANDANMGTADGALGWMSMFLNPAMPVTGDPTLFQGNLDGVTEVPGDRRVALASGPFSLALGDTQEVVVAMIAALGADNRDGINVLKSESAFAQDAFNQDFAFPAAIPAVSLRPVELDRKILLDWESDTTASKNIELYSSRGFRFEKYTVYQFPGPSATGGIVYQIMDPTKPRYLAITEDKIRQRPLVNGQKYYFAITSTMYNPDPGIADPRMESPQIVREILPHAPNPGTVYPYSVNTPVSGVSNLVGRNDAAVKTLFYDPSRPNGHTYNVVFHRFTDPLIDFETKPTWDLIDTTSHDTLIRALSADLPPTRVITRGFTVEVDLPLLGLKGVYRTEAGGKSVHEPVFNEASSDGRVMVVGPGVSDLDDIRGGNPTDNDMELRFTGDSSWAIALGKSISASRWIRVPYTAWSLDLKGGAIVPRQIFTAVEFSGLDSIWRPSVLLDHSYGGKTLEVFYPLMIINDSLHNTTGVTGGTYYDDAPSESFSSYLLGMLWAFCQGASSRTSIRHMYLADVDGDGVAAPSGTVIRFERYKAARNGDVKVFRTDTVATDNFQAAQQEVQRVTAFPNPYYGANRAETETFHHFITFSHLPYNATIRIFNLAGTLVRTIRKTDPRQFTDWDLNNENGLPVGGGLYLAYCELSDQHGLDLGSAVVKLMIVPRDQSQGN